MNKPNDFLLDPALSYLAPNAPWARDFPTMPVEAPAPSTDLSLPRADDAFSAPGEELLGLFRANVGSMAEFARIAKGEVPATALPLATPALKPAASKWWELVFAVPARKPRRRLAAPANRIAGT